MNDLDLMALATKCTYLLVNIIICQQSDTKTIMLTH